MARPEPNVLFLLSDEHSFRCFGRRDPPSGEPVSTPALDELATTGTHFANTYCQMPLCAPSRLCLLSGREVRGAGAWRNGSVLPPRVETLPDVLGDAGYDTCLAGKMHLGGSRQFVGFDDRPYGDLTGGSGHQWEPVEGATDRDVLDRIHGAGVTELPESQLQEYNTMRESLSWIRTQDATSDDPWMLTASFSRPHFPLTAPRRYLQRYWDVEADAPTDRLTAPAVGREGDTTDHPLTTAAISGFRTEDIGRDAQLRARAAYFACVDFLDEVIGEFLATLGRGGHLEDTIVVYASDHGELAGEHGLWWKHTWHEAATRVPFVVQTPGHRRGETDPARIETPVGLIDIFPTLCGLLGLDVPGELDGADLSDTIETGTEPTHGPVVCDNLVPRWGAGTEFRAVREGRYKYVGFRDAPEIFVDLEADPLEQTNLAESTSLTDAQRNALDRLRTFVSETMDFERAEAERIRDDALADSHALDAQTVSPSGNCYLMADGRVLDADSWVYAPDVIVDDSTMTFDGYTTE